MTRRTIALGLAAAAAGGALGQGLVGDRFELSKEDLAALPPIVRKAINATRHSRYAGQRTVEIRSGLGRNTHDEFILKDGSHLRIEFAEGSPQTGQIIVEDSRRRLIYMPDRNEILVQAVRKDATATRLGWFVRRAMKDGFQILNPGVESIAGVPAEQIAIADGKGNVLQRNWIDPVSGVILKRELFDPGGARVGSFVFKRIDFSPKVRPEDFQIVRKGARVVSPEQQAERLARANGMEVVLIPRAEGYRLESSRVFTPPNAGGPVLSLFYAKGGTRLSLFQLKTAVAAQDLRRMVSKRNLANYVWNQDGVWFVLIGDLSEATLRELARKLGDRPSP